MNAWFWKTFARPQVFSAQKVENGGEGCLTRLHTIGRLAQVDCGGRLARAPPVDGLRIRSGRVRPFVSPAVPRGVGDGTVGPAIGVWGHQTNVSRLSRAGHGVKDPEMSRMSCVCLAPLTVIIRHQQNVSGGIASRCLAFVSRLPSEVFLGGKSAHRLRSVLRTVWGSQRRLTSETCVWQVDRTDWFFTPYFWKQSQDTFDCVH